LIKIDVEGHELETLSGLTRRLEQDKPIIILEMNHWCLNAFKRCSIPDFLDQLQAITPHILAFDDGSENAIIIGGENSSATYHVMHEHIVNNKYPTLLLASNPVALKTIVNALAKTKGSNRRCPGLPFFQHLLQTNQILIGDLGLHRAMLGPAHRAEFRLLVDVRRQGFVVILLGPLGIQ